MRESGLSSKKILLMTGIIALVVVGARSLSLTNKHTQPVQLIRTEKQPITPPDNSFQTERVKKPRDKIITYTVEKSDTISSVASKWGISVDTIKWANGLSSDVFLPGQTLQIPPVTGVVHKVAKGDTVESIAATYHTNKQKIIDFPFNKFANPQTFSLLPGTMIIIPDGKR